MAAPQASSRLEMLQARFQQKQLQEKEQKLLQLYDQQQQRAYQVVQRGSAGSSSSNHGSTGVRTATTTTTTTATHTTSTSQGGKVRQMFDERRQTTVKGIDRSYPLEPLENKLRKQTNGVVTQRNGNVTVNRQSVKRVSRADVNSNINGGKPVVSYHEEIIRDSFGPFVRRHDDEDEYGVEYRVATFANGHYRHEIDNEQEEALDQDAIERNRMMAKIHLMGYDETLKHRVRNDLESEEFPEDLVMDDKPDKFSKRSVTKKLSQAEERLERFKNANAKRSNMSKQSTSTSTVVKKRPEQATKSNSRLWSEIAGTSRTGTRSGSDRTSERSQRILENTKSPLPIRTRVADEMNARRRESSDTEILSQRTSPRSFPMKGTTKAESTSRFYPRNNEFKSLTSDGKIFVRRSPSPQFFCRESERSGTTMSIDRKSDSSGSALFHPEMFTKRNRNPRFFLNEPEQYRRTSETKSPIWGDTEISSKRNVSPQYFHYEPKRSKTAMSTDRTIESKSERKMTDFERKKFQTSTTFDQRSSKSPVYEEKRRSTSPQFFCRESERSATTMSIDRATSESRSPSYDREIVTKRSASPFFLNEPKQYRRTSQSKSPIWSDTGIPSRRSTSPQFFGKESERSATTMSIDRATSDSRSASRDREVITNRSTSPLFLNGAKQYRRTSQPKSPTWSDRGISSRRSTSSREFHESKRSETAASTDRETIESKSSEWSKRNTSPQFFCRESDKSATTMLIEPRSRLADSTKDVLKQRSYISDSERPGTTTSIDRKVSEPRRSSYDRKISMKQSAVTPRLSNGKTEQRSATITSIDRKYNGFKSSGITRDKRSTSPQFFGKESERSATTMSIDRATSDSRSASRDREVITNRSTSPLFLNGVKQYRRTSQPKSPTWSDRGISSRRSTNSREFHESKRSETAVSTDRETIESKSSEWNKRNTRPQFFCRESDKSATTMLIEPRSRLADSTKDVLKQRSYISDSERPGTTTSIDRKVSEPRSSSYDRKISMKQSAVTPRLSNGKTEQRSATITSIDRKYNGFKSSGITRDKLSTSPQFFGKESERSATTMSIDRATSDSRSASRDREVITNRSTSPLFLNGAKQYRRTSQPKSPTWSDKGISSRRSTSSREFHESKRSETAASTDRETIESKSSEWNKRNTRPQFFCRESDKSATTMLIEPRSRLADSTKDVLKQRSYISDSERPGTTTSIDRKVSEPRSSSYDRKISMKQSAVTPRLSNGKTEQRSATITSIDRKYNGFKSSGITRDKRSTSPQFFCKESEKSATTMLIEPRSISTDSTKNILKQRSYTSDTSDRRSVKFPIDKINFTKYRRTPRPSVTRHEVKKASSKSEVSTNITGARRSSKISDISATSASSIVNLKYGLELDNIFQSTGPVLKVMKPQNGKQSVTKRNIADTNARRISTRGNRLKNRRKTPPFLQTTRSPSVEGRKRATPEFFRKTITPTEVDMDIQEITMTDHRIERDKLRKASSPISKRQFDGTYTKSPCSRSKFKTSITYPVRKTHRQRESISESSVFKGGLSQKRFIDRQSDRESKESTISLNKVSPVSKGSYIITRDRKDERMSSQTRKSARNEAKYIMTQATKHKDRASSRSPSQNRFAGNRSDSPKVTSPDFSKVRKYPDAVSSMSYDFAERTTKRASTKFDQCLLSTRLVQSAAKDRNLSTDNQYNREKEGDKSENVAVDEVDAEIGVKYQTIVEAALNEDIKDHRRVTRPNSADRITSRKIFLRETTQKPMKSSTSKKTISPTRECGRRHDVKSRVSPLRKTAEISRDACTSKNFLSRNIVSKADRSSTSKFSTYTKGRKHESVLVAKKSAESFNQMSVKRKTEDSVKECSKVLREDKYGKDLKRMDSVESALRRFDSIGAEFECASPTSFRASPEISLQTMDVQMKTSSKELIASKGTTVPSREVTDHTILRSTLKSPVGKDPKAKDAAYKSDLRTLRKETRPSKRPSRVGGFTESKQRSTKIRSPTCKRRLFESDSKEEIQEKWPKSSCVETRKENYSFINFRGQDETISNVRSFKDLNHVMRESMKSEEMLTFSVKPLRSIEDIRKFIDNERNKLISTKESRSAIANRRSASRDGVDAKGSSPVTNAAKDIGADPARLIKIKSCVSRMTKSPSPDSTAMKQRETNARATRGSTPSSPSKSPEIVPRRTESRNQELKPSRRSTVVKGTDSYGSKVTATGAVDTTDGIVLQNGSPNESMTRKSDPYMIDFDDRSSKEDDAMPLKKSSAKKSFNDKQQSVFSASGRPTSSNSSVNLIQDSSAKNRMADSERGKGAGKGGGKSKGKGIEKPSSSSGKLANASFNEDATTDTKGLVNCKTCGRSFAQNRIDLHENICTKTSTKKRKQFDPVMNRVKGTELEPFVKKGLTKRETKTKKSETKPDWRRKHEEFINTIRYARETQARLAAGENLDDLPPPPRSDTSDYVQCEHCGRKFNQSAAERHIPICKRMHDKKQAPKMRR